MPIRAHNIYDVNGRMHDLYTRQLVTYSITNIMTDVTLITAAAAAAATQGCQPLQCFVKY